MSEPCKILVIDDEPLLKSLVNQKFRAEIASKQLEFYFATNGVEALEILKNDKEIGIVITDIRMPKMDGLTLLTHLNQQTRLYKTIVISAFGDMQNVRKAMAEGASDFILKPFDLMDFEISLMNAVEQFRLSKRDIETKNKLDDFSKEMTVAKNLKEAYRSSSHLRGLSIAGEMLLKDDLSSDYFDFHPIRDQRLGIVLADFTSKGMSLTFNTSRLQMLARGAALAENDPEKIHHFLCKQTLNENRGLFFGIFDTMQGKLSYCFSGDILLFSLPHKGKCEKISSEVQTLSLKKNDSVLITTNQLFKLKSLKEEFIENGLKGASPQIALQRLKTDIGDLGRENIPLLVISVEG